VLLLLHPLAWLSPRCLPACLPLTTNNQHGPPSNQHSTGNVNMMLPNSWLWAMVDEFLYQVGG
jgi:hypothetical protein